MSNWAEVINQNIDQHPQQQIEINDARDGVIEPTQRRKDELRYQVKLEDQKKKLSTKIKEIKKEQKKRKVQRAIQRKSALQSSNKERSVQQSVQQPQMRKQNQHGGMGKGKRGNFSNQRNVKSEGISKGSIRRLARRGGIKRIGYFLFDDAKSVVKQFVKQIVKRSVVYMQHARRSTMTAMDVVYGLKQAGRTLYGYGG